MRTKVRGYWWEFVRREGASQATVTAPGGGRPPPPSRTAPDSPLIVHLPPALTIRLGGTLQQGHLLAMPDGPYHDSRATRRLAQVQLVLARASIDHGPTEPLPPFRHEVLTTVDREGKRALPPPVRLSCITQPTAGILSHRRPIWREIGEGWSALFRQPALRTLYQPPEATGESNTASPGVGCAN